MIEVIIADDQKLLRKSLGQLINSDDEIEVIRLVEDGKEAVKFAKILNPDIVVLDIEMPNMNGIDALKIIKENNPEIKVIILTTFDTTENITAAFLEGADAYVGKELSPDELILAIKCVNSGMTVMDESVKGFIIEKIEARLKKSSARKVEIKGENIDIIRLIVDGKSNKSIAEELGYSEGTVKNKVSKIYEKLGINDRLQLAIYAMENNIV